MITYPSLDDLMEKVDSPYTLVILAARRARQLNMGAKELLDEYKSMKPVSMSLEEVAAGKIKYRKNYVKGIK
ncbi:MAG: DNA-directed polymerase subunit omega [Halanaerobiales bacterium]|nr:DNA-directed polymerase subunit omega [Halanaerobiales bacterium]